MDDLPKKDVKITAKTNHVEDVSLFRRYSDARMRRMLE